MEPELNDNPFIASQINLFDILNFHSELIFQETLLDTILNYMEFTIFYDAIFQFPIIYDNIRKKQDYWRLYYLANYPNYPLQSHTTFSGNSYTTDWFYEIVLIEFATTKEYYYISTKHNMKGIMGDHLAYSYKDYHYYDNKYITSQYVLDNQLTMNNISDDKNFNLLGVLTNNKLDLKDIKDITVDTFNDYYILFHNGNIVFSEYNKVEIISKNIKKMILSLVNHIICLSYDGSLYSGTRSAKLELPFKVKDIQDDIYETVGIPIISVTDYNYNIYSIICSNFYKRARELSSNKPLLINTKVLSHCTIHDGRVDKSSMTTTIKGDDVPFLSCMYYITLDMKLNMIVYRDYEILHESFIIPTKDNVPVIKVEIKKVKYKTGNRRDGRQNVEGIFLIYYDLDNNVYVRPHKRLSIDFYTQDYTSTYYDVKYTYFVPEYHMNDVGMKLRLYNEGEPYITQFLIHVLKTNKKLHFVFILSNGEIVYIKYSNDKFFLDYNEDKVRTINIFDYGSEKQLWTNTRISFTNEYSTIISVSYKNGYIDIPYPIYAYNTLIDNILIENRKNHVIIFRIKNNKYVFRTTIPE